MKLNASQLEKLNDVNMYIIQNYDYFEKQKDDLIFSTNKIDEIIKNDEDIDTICYEFPGEADVSEIKVSELLELYDEIKSISIVNNSYIKTKLRRYYIIKASVRDDDYFIRDYLNGFDSSIDDITIRLVNESFIIGLAATKLKEYEEDNWGTISQYLAIEIIYENEKSILVFEKEQNLVNSFIFEFANTQDLVLNKAEIRNLTYDYPIGDELLEESSSKTLNELIEYNEGMRLFVSAVQIDDPELKFLNFYKVLELFSPIAINIEAYELMRKKFDMPKGSLVDGDYIKSIFELVYSIRDRINDEDLIKSSFSNCFDFIGLFDSLPESIVKNIKRNLKIAELNYSVEKQKITTSINIAAKIIYKTRNRVVHAKSNFITTGEEIGSDEIEQLNIFMKNAAYQAIRWYARQPKHLKFEVI